MLPPWVAFFTKTKLPILKCNQATIPQVGFSVQPRLSGLGSGGFINARGFIKPTGFIIAKSRRFSSLLLVRLKAKRYWRDARNSPEGGFSGDLSLIHI